MVQQNNHSEGKKAGNIGYKVLGFYSIYPNEFLLSSK